MDVMSWQLPNIGSRVNREVHARFCARPEVKFIMATRQTPFLSLASISDASFAAGNCLNLARWLALCNICRGSFFRNLLILAPGHFSTMAIGASERAPKAFCQESCMAGGGRWRRTFG